MNREDFLRTERFVQLAGMHPDAMLDLFKLGEPVSLAFVKKISAQDPGFLDKLFNIEFEVLYETNPYLDQIERNDSQAIFAFMKNRYGKTQAEDMVINHKTIWHHFLPYAAKALSEDGRLDYFFQELIKSKNYQSAFTMLEYLPKKYAAGLQKKLKKEDIISLVDYAEEHILNTTRVFNTEYFINNGILSSNIVSIYLFENQYKESAIKKVYRHKGGAEILKNIDSNSVRCFLAKMSN